MSKLSNQEVADEIANKGLWYCITNRIGHRNIEDPKLARAWKRAERFSMPLKTKSQDSSGLSQERL